jgi:transcriptional regulator with XRE-family HTH domain
MNPRPYFFVERLSCGHLGRTSSNQGYTGEIGAQRECIICNKTTQELTPMTFGEYVRQSRRTLGLTQRELAEQVDAMALAPDQHMDYVLLSKIENGRVPPPVYEVVCHLAVALNPDVDDGDAHVSLDLIRLSREPFMPTPPLDIGRAVCDSESDDAEVWEAKLAKWNEMAG